VLAVLTGSDALVLLAFKSGDVKSFATPKLDPILTDTQGRSLIGTLLAKDQAKTADAPPAPSAQTPPTATPEDSVKWEEEDIDSAEYIDDEDKREKEFKTRFTQILNKVRFPLLNSLSLVSHHMLYSVNCCQLMQIRSMVPRCCCWWPPHRERSSPTQPTNFNR